MLNSWGSLRVRVKLNAGLQGNLLNETFSHYIDSRLHLVPAPIRDVIKGASAYGTTRMIEYKQAQDKK